jgi:hypothetical protein
MFQGRGDGLGARAGAAQVAELAQILRRFVVAMDHLVDVVDVEHDRTDRRTLPRRLTGGDQVGGWIGARL